MKREQVYKVIDGERAYQDNRWGQKQTTIGQYIVYMQDYLTESIHHLARENTNDKALESLRKVVALGVACFEEHGVPERNQ